MPQALTPDNSSCVAGGAIRSEQHSSSALYAHDIIGKLWLTKARMHLKRYMFCLETVNDNIYACGGRSNDSTPVNSFEVYSPLENQWTILHQGNPSNDNHYGRSSVVKDEMIYLVGNLETCRLNVNGRFFRKKSRLSGRANRNSFNHIKSSFPKLCSCVYTVNRSKEIIVNDTSKDYYNLGNQLISQFTQV